MKILVLGATGMLGHQVVQTLGSQHELFATVRNNADGLSEAFPALQSATLLPGVQAESFGSVVNAMAQCRPAAVINCIGIVKQIAAAKDPVTSITINALLPHRLAKLCRATDARLIHLGTDCVFSGNKGTPYTEHDLPDATDLYGRTKLLGEVDGAGCLTLRTSIIGRELRRGTGLVEWFLSRAGSTIQGYSRALYTGVTTQVLARLIGDLLEQHPSLTGVWQVASDPINKYDLLQLLNEAFKTNTTIQRDDSFFCDRRLDGQRFAATTGFRAPSWLEMVKALTTNETATGERKHNVHG